MNNCLPVFRRAVGYQPVGMRPRRRFVATENTATALLSPSATYSFEPSGDNASAFGVLPSEGPPGAASLSIATIFRRFVSTTAILSSPPIATYTPDPERLLSTAQGCLPTRIRPPQ